LDELGQHILIEYYECDKIILNDLAVVTKMMGEAAEAAGAEIINSTFHQFSPQGVSGVVIITESHITIHTWPEYGYAAVDIFTCGDYATPWKAYRYIKKGIKSQKSFTRNIRRGNWNKTREQFDVKNEVELDEIKWNYG